MKVTRSHLQIAILVLGGILILYGIVKLLFKINLGPVIEQNLPTVVMVGAAGIFLWNRQLWSQEKKAEEAKAEQEKAEQEKAEQEKVEQEKAAVEAQAPADSEGAPKV